MKCESLSFVSLHLNSGHCNISGISSLFHALNQLPFPWATWTGILFRMLTKGRLCKHQVKLTMPSKAEMLVALFLVS
jgi:hypothetical protein